MNPTVLFLCPHGAAKSIMAAAYFHKLADQKGLTVRAIAAGTDPSAEASPFVVELLAKEGIDVSSMVPQRVSHDQMANASRIISLGCDLDSLPPSKTRIEQWDDVPPPSQDLMAARNSIYAHVLQLVAQYQ